MKTKIAIASAAFLLCYAVVLGTIAGVWANNPLYSFGFIVPLISGYVLFTKADELREQRPRPDYLVGVTFVVLGLGMLVFGNLGSITTAQQLSLVLTLAGLVLLLFGRRVLKLALFPLLYLLVGVPIWDRALQGLQAPSQMLSGAIAITFLHAIGVPAFREGTTLVLPNVTLDILRECSGVNQLIAVFAMTVPAAYLWLRGLLRRGALVAFAISVAYLSNGFRIAMVGFLEYHHFTGGNIRGLHMLEGLATSVVGYSLIFICLSVLSRTQGRTPQRPAESHADQSGPAIRSQVGVEAGVLALAVLTGVFITTYRPADVTLNRRLQLLPTQLGSWTLDSSHPISSGYRLGVADDELDRMYQGPSGERLRLYIGYQRSGGQGRELSSAENWELARSASPIEVSLDSQVVRLNEVEQVSGTVRKGKLFWFDLDGREVTNWYLVKGYTIWNALTSRRTNGAIVLVEWDSPMEADVEASRREAIGFVRLLRPHLAGYMPS